MSHLEIQPDRISNSSPFLDLGLHNHNHTREKEEEEEEEIALMKGPKAKLALIAVVMASVVVGSSLTMVAAGKNEASFIRKTVSSHEIVIFSKSYCPYCRRAKGVFKELNKVPYVVELDQRDDGFEIQNTLSEIVGRRTVPQVFINGEYLGGSDDTVAAYESGELAKKLNITLDSDL